MLTDDIRPFRFENMFNIIIDKRFVDPECICKTIEGGNQNAPLLKLTPEGISALAHFDFAGGRHRMRAMELVKAERTDRLRKLQDQVRKLKDKAEDKGEDVDANENVARLEESIKEEGNYLAKLGRWGVMLYDSGE